MTDMTLDLAENGMLAITRDALAALRNALMRDAGPSSASWFQEAGYAGGDGAGAFLSSRYRTHLSQRQ